MCGGMDKSLTENASALTRRFESGPEMGRILCTSEASDKRENISGIMSKTQSNSNIHWLLVCNTSLTEALEDMQVFFKYEVFSD